MNINPSKHVFTLEEIEEQLKEMFDNNTLDKKVIMYQGCLEQGSVRRDALNLNLCNNPDCVSCKFFDTLLKESADEFLKNNLSSTEE